MPAVEVRGGSQRDEELGAVGAGRGGRGGLAAAFAASAALAAAAAPRRRDEPPARKPQPRVQLVAERLSVHRLPAEAGPRRVARLDHQIGDHAVEEAAVVVALEAELHEVADGLGGLLGPEFDVDVARGGVQDHLRERGRARGRFFFFFCQRERNEFEKRFWEEKRLEKVERERKEEKRKSLFSPFMPPSVAASSSFLARGAVKEAIEGHSTRSKGGREKEEEKREKVDVEKLR